MHFTVQIFASDSAVVKAQEHIKVAWKLPNLCNAPSQESNKIRWPYCDEEKKRPSDIQTARALENHMLRTVGPTKDKIVLVVCLFLHAVGAQLEECKIALTNLIKVLL